MTIASGTFGTADLAATVGVQLCINDSSKAVVANLCWANRNGTSVRVRCAVSQVTTFGAITNDQWLDYDTQIAAQSPYERCNIVLAPGDRVYVRSDTSNVSVRAQGLVGRIP